MRRRLAFLGVFLTCVCMTAPARAIIGGAPDGAGHSAVAAIADPSGHGVIFTGTAISSTVVLTAAHAVARLEAATGSDQAGVSFDTVVSSSTVWYQGTIHIDPAFNPNVPGVGDHAVIVFDDPLPVSPAALPTESALSRIAPTTLRSTSFPVVGYGLSRLVPGSPNPDFTSGGTRKSDRATFQGLKPQLLKLQLPGHDQVCIGDSGGPSFLGDTSVISGITLGALGGCISSGAVTQMRVDTPAARAFLGNYVQLP